MCHGLHVGVEPDAQPWTVAQQLLSTNARLQHDIHADHSVIGYHGRW